MSEFKRYPKYKESGIEWLGEVPEHWGISKLKWVSNFIYGDSLSNENRMEGAIPVYGSNGITGYHNKAITNKPCIIIGRKGSFGKINFSDIECFPIDTTYYIDNTATKHNLYWLRYVLDILRLDEYTKDAAVPGLAREEAYHKLISVPSIEEQRLIAESIIYKTIQIDTLIEKKQKLIELLKEYRTAVINQAVTKGLNPDVPMKDSGIEWLGEVPEHWKVMKLKFASRKITDGEHISPRTANEGIPLLSAKDVRERRLSFDVDKFINIEDAMKFRNRCNPEKGDILMVSRGATIGRIGFVESDEMFCLMGSVILIKPKKTICPIYLYYALNLDRIKENLLLASESSAQQAIYLIDVGDLYIPLPKIDEQKEIAASLECKCMEIDTIINKTQQQISLLKEYRTTLISDVVTGKIDVRGEV